MIFYNLFNRHFNERLICKLFKKDSLKLNRKKISKMKLLFPKKEY